MYNIIIYVYIQGLHLDPNRLILFYKPNKRSSIQFKFFGSNTVDLGEAFGGGGFLGAHVDEGFVGKDYVGRDAEFVG